MQQVGRVFIMQEEYGNSGLLIIEMKEILKRLSIKAG